MLWFFAVLFVILLLCLYVTWKCYGKELAEISSLSNPSVTFTPTKSSTKKPFTSYITPRTKELATKLPK